MRSIVLFLFAFSLISQVRAQSLISTGPSASTISQGVSDGIFDSLAKHAGDWISNGMAKIGNWALQTLFQVYDKYIGTFLIYVPDLAAPATYTALGALNTNAVQVVLNLLKITCGTGLFILIVGLVIDTGQRSSGLWNRFIDPNLVIGFVAAFICLFGWPTLFSYLTAGVTAMGYYVYNQNTLRTSGVLEGLSNIDLTGAGAVGTLSNYDFRGNFITIQGIAWNLIYLIAIGLVVLGFYNCYSAVSAGDSKKGNYRFFQAVAGMILILGTPTLVHILIAKGADTIGNQPAIPGQTLSTFSLQGLVQDNGIQYPAQGGGASSNIGTAVTATPPTTSHWAIFAAGLLKCGVALWGLIICFAVIFAKFFQVLNLWVLFVLGPIFIGCLGHPATAPIFWGAARYFVKLLLYSLVWAITLVGLYLIPNINWGVETIGVNSLLTAVAVLAGLQLIANVQEFSSLFTTFSGANLKGDGYKEFTRDTGAALGTMNAARLGAFGALAGATGETGQAMAVAGGAALGSVIPGVGTVGGAKAAEGFAKGVNAFAKMGSVGAKHKDPNSENPVSSFLKKTSSNVISNHLDKEAKKNLDLTPEDQEKRQALHGYAQRLKRSKGPNTSSRGEGREKRT